MRVISTEKKPIKLWLDDIEDGALEQAKNLANLPFVHRHIALMPDSHQGKGMPIGGVIATTGVVIPNAVGVDIGCGMCACRTNLKKLTKNDTKLIMGKIRKRVPVGFDHHEQDMSWKGFHDAPDVPIVQQQLKSARKQLGTLGGGNHFIEIQKGDDGYVWVMIHSGSRNFGYQIARTYNNIAQKLCERWHSNIPKFKGDDGLAFLPIEIKEAKEYMEAMNFALDFAKANRFRMLEFIKESFIDVVRCTFGGTINIHHNYATWEHHFGRNVIVHRKGATSAKKGQSGIIPGSQGAKSYIVKGLGNPDSFNSCSHGAGRVLSRTQAKKQLNLNEEIAKLDALGVVHSIRNIDDLDEASGAYKDISVVMKNQADLVDIDVELRPLGVIKDNSKRRR